jgi:hypothetical protein
MTHVERFADQLQRTFYRDAWCDPSPLETLEGVTVERAASSLVM